VDANDIIFFALTLLGCVMMVDLILLILL